MRWLALLWGLGLALAQGFAPNYPPLENPAAEGAVNLEYLFSFPDLRYEQLQRGRWPFLEVIRSSELRRHQAEHGQNPPQNTPHEWRIPFSTLPATQGVTRDLRLAWQRFEERYYQNTLTRLNNPAFYLSNCVVGLRLGDLDPPTPPASLMVERSSLPTGFDPGLGFPEAASRGTHRLDRYLPTPQVDKGQFCDDLSLELLPVMYIPAFCVDADQIGFSWCSQGFPDQPLWMNYEAAEARVRAGIERAHGLYQLEYQREVLQALAPRLPTTLTGQPQVFAPVPWQSHLLGAGAVIAPVMSSLLPEPARVTGELEQSLSTLHQALPALPQTERLVAYPYYYQLLIGLGRLPVLQSAVAPLRGWLGNLDEASVKLTLSRLKSLDETATAAGQPLHLFHASVPGVWRLEELKRWMPPQSPLVAERLGYASFFMAWNRFETATVPDLGAAWASPLERTAAFLGRLVAFWHVPLRLKVSFQPTPPYVSTTPQLELPRPLPIAPYVLPFVGERTHYGWLSVPEGYGIPLVRGTPGRGLPGAGIPGLDFTRAYDLLLR
ncbi:hypothetical protein [uncultured Meiothermus sp.]|jgi:hypothetical protein|uniref:hypothetical protein n=1 Tax=uncultured Meiothermus sp. TaxID=157471 RepID=UPI00260AEE1A|nr:hypothetical protein [uncultured Meiothermus sp.]